MKTNQTHSTDQEVRSLGEIRAAEPESTESRKVVGYAAKFDTRSEYMGFYEVIKPGAFTDALKSSDVRALFNHDPNLILARTSSGTLKLTQDKIGLRYEFEVPNTSYGNDFLEAVKRGDVSQSSFAFTLQRDGAKWIQEEVEGVVIDVREIYNIKRVYDVSPVTYPAYTDTTIAARDLQSMKGTPPTPDSTGDPDEDDIYKKRMAYLDALERSARH